MWPRPPKHCVWRAEPANSRVDVRIRELSDTADVKALEPFVLEFFQIICGFLDSDFDVQLDPADPTSAMMETPEKFVFPQGRGYVVARDGVLMGMVFLRHMHGTDYEIKRLYIRKEARGLGLGKRLVRHAIDVARTLGVTELYLDTIPSLKTAISLYEREGFQPRGPYIGSEIAEHEQLRDLGVYMQLSLNAVHADTNS